MRDYAAIMAIQQATVAATEPYDLVLSPVAPMAAFPAEWPMPWGEGDEAMSHIGFTAPFNLSGQPAGTVNAGFTADGRTMGLHVSGRRFDDVGCCGPCTGSSSTARQRRPNGRSLTLVLSRRPRPASTQPPTAPRRTDRRGQPCGAPRWQTASTLLPSGSRTKAP